MYVLCILGNYNGMIRGMEVIPNVELERRPTLGLTTISNGTSTLKNRKLLICTGESSLIVQLRQIENVECAKINDVYIS